MKNLIASKKLHLTLAVASLLVASCYKLQSIDMPHEVAPEAEFTISATIVNDHWEAIDNDSYGCFGISVPEDWTVEVPRNGYEYYASDDAVPVAYEATMNEIYTAIMEHRYHRDGYKWIGFSTEKMKHKLTKSPDKVDGDKKYTADAVPVDRIVANLKVKTGTTPGDYQLEFLAGDETENFEKYLDNMDHNPQSDPRLFEAGTFAADPAKENQVNKEGEIKPSIHNVLNADTKISVSTTTGIVEVLASEFEIVGCGGGYLHKIERCGA